MRRAHLLRRSSATSRCPGGCAIERQFLKPNERNPGVPTSATSVRISPVCASCIRTSSRTCARSGALIVTYEPRTSTSLFNALRMRAVVPRSSVSLCDQGDVIRRCATSSPEISRSLFSGGQFRAQHLRRGPVASHASSLRPERFLNPSTATDLRIWTFGLVEREWLRMDPVKGVPQVEPSCHGQH